MVGRRPECPSRKNCPMMALEREGSQTKPGGQWKTVEREREREKKKQRLGIGSLGARRS